MVVIYYFLAQVLDIYIYIVHLRSFFFGYLSLSFVGPVCCCLVYHLRNLVSCRCSDDDKRVGLVVRSDCTLLVHSLLDFDIERLCIGFKELYYLLLVGIQQ